MRNSLKNLLYGSLEYSGLNQFYRKKTHRSLRILTYHSVLPYSEKFDSFDYRNCVSTERFDRQLAILKNSYRPVTLSEALQRLQNNELQGNEVVISFDDGFLNNHDYALPVLQKHNLSAVFYISTAFIGKQEMLWTEKVNDILMNAKCEKIEIVLDKKTIINLQTVALREQASVKVRSFLKYRPWKIQEDVIGQLISQTGYVPQAITNDPERYAFMGWEDVCRLNRAGMEVGSHTHNHLLLNMLNEEESYRELQLSRDLIEQNLGRKCLLFSYPNGAPGNFLPRHYKQLEKLGYRCAVTQVPGFNTSQTPNYALKRINITSKMDVLIFKACLSGSRNLIKL